MAKKNSKNELGALNPILPLVIIAVVVVAAIVVISMKKMGAKPETAQMTQDQTVNGQNVQPPSGSLGMTESSPTVPPPSPTGGTNVSGKSLDELDASLDTQLRAADTDSVGIDQGLKETPADLSSN